MTETNAKYAAPGRETTASWSVPLLFLLILFLGAAVRTVHLTSESVWWDEFATVVYLEPPREYTESPHFPRWNQMVIREPSPTLAAFLKQNRQLDPAAMPMYLAVEYYWNRFVHPSPLALRILSLIIGVAVLPVVYLTGRRIYDARVGLIAMLCVAFSPIHVQFSKEIRMYGLMTLLAILSSLAFTALVERDKRKRWWVIYAGSTLLLSWTHPFAMLLPGVQGLFWFISRPRDIKRIFGWGLLTAALTLPAAAYVLTIQFWEVESTETWMRLPTVMELINDIFADDAIGATYQTKATSTAWAWLLGDAGGRWMLAWRWKVGHLMVIGAAAAMVTAWFRFRAGASRPVWAAFLSMWVVLPPVTLYILSALWRPCHQPRYTIHASLGLYLLLGCAIVSLPRRLYRFLALACLVAFYFYQQMLMIGEPQHPDWLGAARVIHEEASPDDLVLAHNWLWKRVFAYNLGPVPNVVSYGGSYDVLAEMCAFFLDLHGTPSSGSQESMRGVWVVVRTDYFESGALPELETELHARGLQYDFREFGGIQHVLLYHVTSSVVTPRYRPSPSLEDGAAKGFADLSLEFWRAGDYDTAARVAENATRLDPEFSHGWSYLGMALKELEQREEALDAFQRAVAVDADAHPWDHVNIAMLLIDLDRFDEAVTAATRAVDILPNDPWALTMLGTAHYERGEYERAISLLRKAVDMDMNDMRIRNALDAALQAAGQRP